MIYFLIVIRRNTCITLTIDDCVCICI